MADFVAEMAQERAIGLLPQRALLLAMDVVRLGNVHGDQSIVVSREYALSIAIAGILQKLKCQSGTAITVLGCYRQPEFEQGIQHSALGELQAMPRSRVPGTGKIRNDPTQATRYAKPVGLIGGH